MGSAGEDAEGGSPAENANALLKPRAKIPALLANLSETRPPCQLDWLGASFGMTLELFNFWQKCGMSPVYLRPQCNDVTGEHSAIMVKSFGGEGVTNKWLSKFQADFRSRFLRQLGGCFRQLSLTLALSVAAAQSGASAAEEEQTAPHLLPLASLPDLLR